MSRKVVHLKTIRLNVLNLAQNKLLKELEMLEELDFYIKARMGFLKKQHKKLAAEFKKLLGEKDE